MPDDFPNQELTVRSDALRTQRPARRFRNDEVSFTCGHCGAKVSGMPVGQDSIPFWMSRNACTRCGWSAHTEFGTEDRPACGALMRPRRVGDHLAVWRCVGCGFMMRGPTEEAMDLLVAGEFESLPLTVYSEGSKITWRPTPR